MEVIAHLIEHQPFAKHEFALADKAGEFSRQVDGGAVVLMRQLEPFTAEVNRRLNLMCQAAAISC